MKGNRRLIAFLLAVMMLTSMLPTTAYADTKTAAPNTSAAGYVAEDYPESPNEGYVRMTKSADWVDSAKTKAQVTLSVWGEPVATGADVLFILDISNSMGNRYNWHGDWIDYTLDYDVCLTDGHYDETTACTGTMRYQRVKGSWTAGATSTSYGEQYSSWGITYRTVTETRTGTATASFLCETCRGSDTATVTGTQTRTRTQRLRSNGQWTDVDLSNWSDWGSITPQGLPCTNSTSVHYDADG